MGKPQHAHRGPASERHRHAEPPAAPARGGASHGKALESPLTTPGGWFLPTGSRPGPQACPHRLAGGQRLGNSHEGLTQRAHTGTPPPPHPAQEGAGTFSGRKSPWRLGAEAAGIPATVQ